jgi:hypothetical protein
MPRSPSAFAGLVFLALLAGCGGGSEAPLPHAAMAAREVAQAARPAPRKQALIPIASPVPSAAAVDAMQSTEPAAWFSPEQGESVPAPVTPPTASISYENGEAPQAN